MKNNDIEIVYVNTSEAALQAFSAKDFTMILLDAQFLNSRSEEDSHRLLTSMQKANPIPILVLSTKSGASHARMDGIDVLYNRKSFTLSESVSFAQGAIKTLLEQDSFEEYDYILARGKDLVIDPVQREVTLKGNKLRLTRKEFDILYYLAANPGRVLTREQLYSHVWTEDNAYDVDSIVKTHISTLRKKLADADVEYIRNIWGVGYKFEPEESEK